MVPNPEKHPDLLGAIKKAVETGQYLDTTHVTQRKSQRQVLRTEIEYVLCHGHHAAKKDKFDEMNQAWNYAIEGSTLDKRKLRVIVSFDEEKKLLIITVIDLGSTGGKDGKKN